MQVETVSLSAICSKCIAGLLYYFGHNPCSTRTQNELQSTRTSYDFPSDLGVFPITFVTPECLRELASIAFLQIFNPLVVIIKTGFKLGCTATEVMLGVVITR